MVRGVVTRAVVSAINDGGGLQVLQLRGPAEVTWDGVERLQNYGLTSNPPAGGEALALRVGGASDHVVVLAVESREYRVQGLASGEVCLYDDQGQRVTIYRDRVEVEAPNVVVKSADVELGSGGLLPTDGVVQGTAIDPFTGMTQAALGNASGTVKAST